MSDDAKNFLEDLNDDIIKTTPDPQPDPTKEPEVTKKPETELEDDDDPLKLSRQPAKKPTKEESNAILRKQRDDFAKRIEEYEKKFTDLPPDAITPFVDYLTEIGGGVIDKDVAVKVIEEIKTKDAEIADLRTQLDEKEKKVSEIDIRHSQEFKEKYQEPYSAAGNSMLLEFAVISPDNKILGPQSTKVLHDFLAEKASEIDATTVKGKLLEFKRNYKEETGEDVDLPSVTAMMQAVRVFDKTKKDMHEAYTNWGKRKKEQKEKSQAEQERERELAYRSGKRERMSLATKAFNSFDLDRYDFVKEDELKKIVEEEFKAGEKIMQGDDVPPYDMLIMRGVHANLWEANRDNYLRLLKAEEQLKSKPGSFNGPASNTAKDWLED